MDEIEPSVGLLSPMSERYGQNLRPGKGNGEWALRQRIIVSGDGSGCPDDDAVAKVLA
jgi:hypothetical protein